MKVLHLLAFAALLSFASGAAVCSSVMHSDPNYWTPERMANAIPLDIIFNDTDAPAGLPLPRACSANNKKFTDPAVYSTNPFKSVGKVFFSSGSSNFVCSGSIGDAARGLIWTAGHCVSSGTGQFYTNWRIIIAYNNGAAPFGTWSANRLCAQSQYHNGGDLGYDYALARVTGIPTSGFLSFAPAINVPQNTQIFTSYGYPQGPPFNGAWENTCTSSSCFIDDNFLPPTTGISCDSTGGSSGGPWLIPSGSTWKIGSLNSYGYNSLANTMFGPYFNGDTQTFFNNVMAIADKDLKANSTKISTTK